MIQANKATVLTDFNLGSVSLQFMEIEYFLLVFNRITKIASLLAGFASAALMQTASARPEYPRLHLLHVLATGGAFGLMLLVLLIATFCSMWGPGLALRGAGSRSVSKAVEVMDWAQQATIMYLNVGLWCFLLSSIASALIFQPPLACVTLMCIIITAMTHLYTSDYEIKAALIPRGLTKAEIRGNPLSRKLPPKPSAKLDPSNSMYYYCEGYEPSPYPNNNNPTSASSTAETLQMPQWVTGGGGRTLEQARSPPSIPNHHHNIETSADSPALLSSPTVAPRGASLQQQRGETENEEGGPMLRQLASSAYTSALETFASFVGLTGEDVEGEDTG